MFLFFSRGGAENRWTEYDHYELGRVWGDLIKILGMCFAEARAKHKFTGSRSLYFSSYTKKHTTVYFRHLVSGV